MTDHADSPIRPSVVRRVGLWLGPILFAAILAQPLTPSMRAAADAVVRGEIAKRLATDVGRTEPSTGVSASSEQRMDDYVAARAAWFESEKEQRTRAIVVTAAVTAWVACWWISLAAPLGATSLLPLVLLPLMGALPLKSVAVSYANPNVFLFMGGFMIALGIERWGLHRRIALHIVRAVGVGESRIVLGFMIASGLLSMWISNTATTLMMFPIGLAIIRSLPDIATSDGKKDRSRFPAAGSEAGEDAADDSGGVADEPLASRTWLIRRLRRSNHFRRSQGNAIVTW